ncbi:GTPase involved in G-protein signaling [Komagataella phaffii CBS 7435]|uniref:small monomeric GTPase n=2 Tax=Komagataella phaffii TaxID=460519 RepID=C4R8L5_KOMPG|nr:GTP-binding protein [Komagataella phaffii GS115]AOA64909.1 GQ67_05057T0 [Komagataella phaffii]CAH2450658.1 GTPase involved in G-protein signaling [Komagataella phaffii CBS 7435]AOA69712.1 GQ68_05038T0 [Komagataella phaffii GS115]CAY71940.1 GTP-binding protein [Komagataella phaffii GS115]CCA40459.1 GTPase involved in G-protein signaling [Komagataella phaffii CBS 7435]
MSEDYRLVVVGPPSVGKSALTIQLIRGEFLTEYDPTIEDSYKHPCEIDGAPVMLDILDTAGQEDYSSMKELYMKTGEGFLLVFAINKRSSLEELKPFYDQIVRVKEGMQSVPMVLVGNKSDVEDSKREVSRDEGEALARQFGCQYIETSAKTNTNVKEAFYNVVRATKSIKDTNQTGIDTSVDRSKNHEKPTVRGNATAPASSSDSSSSGCCIVM